MLPEVAAIWREHGGRVWRTRELKHDPEKPAPDLVRGEYRFPAFAKPASADGKVGKDHTHNDNLGGILMNSAL
jgi:hypothetical protein